MAPLDPESDEAIGERLELIRLAYSTLQGFPEPLDQAEFARLCGISRQMWNNAERGRARLGIENAKLVQRKVGADILYIYYGDTRVLPHNLALEIGKLAAKRRAANSR